MKVCLLICLGVLLTVEGLGQDQKGQGQQVQRDQTVQSSGQNPSSQTTKLAQPDAPLPKTQGPVTPLPTVRNNDDPYYDPSSVERKKNSFVYEEFTVRKQKYEEAREQALARRDRGEKVKEPEQSQIYLIDELELIGVVERNDGELEALVRPTISGESSFTIRKGSRLFNGYVDKIIFKPEKRLVVQPQVILVETPPKGKKVKGETITLTTEKKRRVAAAGKGMSGNEA
jgi:hypothetical protein